MVPPSVVLSDVVNILPYDALSLLQLLCLIAISCAQEDIWPPRPSHKQLWTAANDAFVKCPVLLSSALSTNSTAPCDYLVGGAVVVY